MPSASLNIFKDLKLDNTQKSQESQYAMPYHYIPVVDQKGFSQAFTWSWGMRYLAGIEAVLYQLRKKNFNSLIDVGCGDGRFLREAAIEFQTKVFCGVDYSERAIKLAQAMNPNLDYRCQNIIHDNLNERFDIATMVEVLEHIPPHDVGSFLIGVAKHLNPDGVLILTVPHTNKTLQEKHYQHFSRESLSNVLEASFVVDKVIPFDYTSHLTNRLIHLLGYSGKNYIIINKKVMNWAYSQILRGCLEPQSEKKCGRLLAIARVRNT